MLIAMCHDIDEINDRRLSSFMRVELIRTMKHVIIKRRMFRILFIKRKNKKFVFIFENVDINNFVSLHDHNQIVYKN